MSGLLRRIKRNKVRESRPNGFYAAASLKAKKIAMWKARHVQNEKVPSPADASGQENKTSAAPDSGEVLVWPAVDEA